MPVKLFRVDDRLVHGQVVVGWGQPLGVRLVILVDDEVSAEEWEQDLYRTTMPPGMELIIASLDQAAQQLPRWHADKRRSVLLTAGIPAMLRLAREHPEIVTEINLGGLHHRPDRHRRLPYIYLTDDELRDLREASEAGVRITAQDLPRTVKVPVKDLV